MTELSSMFSYHFMQRALIVGVLVSLCAALLTFRRSAQRFESIRCRFEKHLVVVNDQNVDRI